MKLTDVLAEVLKENKIKLCDIAYGEGVWVWVWEWGISGFFFILAAKLAEQHSFFYLFFV